ncbi:hypothetical protein J3F83DRAFT_415981 [Trichoderma novae-zelandiae]
MTRAPHCNPSIDRPGRAVNKSKNARPPAEVPLLAECVMPPYSHTSPLFSHLLAARGGNERAKARGSEKRGKRGRRAAPLLPVTAILQSLSPASAVSWEAWTPRLRIHFPPRHFPDCRDGGAVDKAWVFRTVRLRPPAKPARKTDKKQAEGTEPEAAAKGNRCRSCRANGGHSVATLRRPSPPSCSGSKPVERWQIGAVVLASGIHGWAGGPETHIRWLA